MPRETVLQGFVIPPPNAMEQQQFTSTGSGFNAIFWRSPATGGPFIVSHVEVASWGIPVPVHIHRCADPVITFAVNSTWLDNRRARSASPARPSCGVDGQNNRTTLVAQLNVQGITTFAAVSRIVPREGLRVDLGWVFDVSQFMVVQSPRENVPLAVTYYWFEP